MTTAGLVCGSCGTEVSAKVKFCSECGASIMASTIRAEYKQVTVRFADVVHSMDIAATVGRSGCVCTWRCDSRSWPVQQRQPGRPSY
jgi:hypothetical protein